MPKHWLNKYYLSTDEDVMMAIISLRIMLGKLKIISMPDSAHEWRKFALRHKK